MFPNVHRHRGNLKHVAARTLVVVHLVVLDVFEVCERDLLVDRRVGLLGHLHDWRQQTLMRTDASTGLDVT